MLIRITDYPLLDERRLMDLYAESNEENADVFFPEEKDRAAAHARADLSITLKNDGYKGRGIGTKALCDAVRYAFTELDLCEVFANALKTNVRSRHVLEKAGFTRVGENAEYVFYRIDRQRNAEEETGSEAFGEPFVRSGDPSMEDA